MAGVRLRPLASLQKDSRDKLVRKEETLGARPVDHRAYRRQESRLLGLKQDVHGSVCNQAENIGTSPGGAIVENRDIRALKNGIGQNFALTTTQIPAGDDCIDHFDGCGAEGLETVRGDRARAARYLGENTTWDNQRVAKAGQQVEMVKPVEDDER